MRISLAEEVVVTGTEGFDADTARPEASTQAGPRSSPRSEDAAVPAAADDFADWVAPHLAVLTALAVREVGRADADDVVQETLVRAWRRRETFRPDLGTPRAWLIGILFDRSRRHRVRSRPAELFGLRRDGAPSSSPNDAPAGALDVGLERAIACRDSATSPGSLIEPVVHDSEA